MAAGWDAKVFDVVLYLSLLFHRRRVFAAAGGNIAAGAMDESFLGGGNIGVFAVPDLHGRFLNGAREGERQTPGHAVL